MKANTQPELFAYQPERFADLAQQALACALELGATDAVAEVSEGVGLSVSARCGEVENVERNRDKSLGMTVYMGQSSGSASTSDFSPEALRSTVRAAFDIARYTAADPFSGLPMAEDLMLEKTPDLDLFHPWLLSAEDAMELALRAEGAAFATAKGITNSEGASVSAQHSHFWMMNSRGFSDGYAASRHSISVAPIAGKGEQMQRDYWYSSMRDPVELAQPEAIGRYAAERALSRLGACRIPTGEYPVLFESPLAAGLLGAMVQATSGNALYRRTTFLVDSLGQPVFAPHIQVDEDPFILKGKGSSPFDAEGVKTQARRVVDSGVLQGYFLGSYSARKLGMRTTGNAGGSHNLRLSSSQTQAGDDLDAMLRKLHRGLFITELIGQGVNYVTGDYSRGAAGYWVENGRIAYPVQEITIAGNLKEIFSQMIAVGADAYTYGAKTTGSILVEHMKVAGI